jgi:L-ascorbate metabolism protein UlaG (beta-lactamase superfamily)
MKEVFADPEVDAVSVCTDHADHAPTVIAALKGEARPLRKGLASTFAGLDKMRPRGASIRAGLGGVFQHRFDGNLPLRQEPDRMRAPSDHAHTGPPGQVPCAHDAYYKADKWRGTWAREAVRS